jgi:hypothetical protein
MPIFFSWLLCLLTTMGLWAQYPATNGQRRLKDNQQRASLEAESLLKNVSFRNIGPTVMGGRVVDIAANPANPTEFYAAYATGGLWHTVNNGLSFASIFDNNDHLFMGAIAVNWQTRTIWVGTGEVNSSRSSYAGTGMYKSNNNGKTWQYLGLPESHHIGKIVLHPTDSNTAWVAVLGHLYSFNKERGVYKTIDGGKTWKQVLFINEKTGAVDIVVNPLDPNTLHASMWYRTRTAWNFEEAGQTSGIYTTTDGGNSWHLLTNNNSGFPTGNGVGRIGLAIYPPNPKIVYAVVDNQTKKSIITKDTVSSTLTLANFKAITKEKFATLDTLQIDSFLKQNQFPTTYKGAMIKMKVAAGVYKPTVLYDYLKTANTDLFDANAIHGCQVYKSEDAGQHWQLMNRKELPMMYNTYGYYFGKIWISPTNANKLYITGVPIMESTDSGKTFIDISGKNVHTDHHAVWVNPQKDSHLIVGNDGGVNITYNDGRLWYKVSAIAAGQFYSVTTDEAKPYNVYGGLQDNGSWYGSSVKNKEPPMSTENGDGFKFIEDGDGMVVQVDTRNNATIYAGFQFGYYFKHTKGTDQSKPFRPQPILGETPFRFNWKTPLALSTHQQDVIYVGSHRFHRSLNQADTMITLSGDLTKGAKTGDVPYGTLTCIAESPLKFGLLYTGSDDGLLHISSDGGYTFTRVGTKLPPNLWITCVTASLYKESRVYVTMSGYRYDHFEPYVFVSEDYGKNFMPIKGNLPLEAVNVIKEDTKKENILYVGTDQGLYASINRGKTYMRFSTNFPRVPVHDLVIQKSENELVVGTHGRSIYIAKLDSVQQLLPNNK